MITSNFLYNLGEVYGQTLFELAAEYGQTENVKSDLDAIDQFMFSEGDFYAIVSSPFLAVEQKRKLAETLFAGRVCELTMDFLLVTGEKNRLAALPNIIKKFNRLYRESKGYKDVWMTVSHAIDPIEKEQIRSQLAAAFQTENITLEFNVEPAILGGTIIRYEGKMIDNSVRTRLHRAVDTIISKGRNSGKSI